MPEPAPDEDDHGFAILARQITKAYGGVPAVAGASVAVRDGELVALLGPSGSGKTTLLRVIAGFERPDGGTVRVGGRTVSGRGAWVEPERRRVGMVFQQGALFPHLTVAGNAGFGAARPGRGRECLELVGLAGRAASYPHELSGGERQRVALARALAADPEAVLLDEPFAGLDAGLRQGLGVQVAAILRAAGTSALLVTHDQAEALSLADTVAVMRAGRIEQVGAPEAVYARPHSRWVAQFLGDADVLRGTARAGVVDCELGRFPAAAELRGDVDVVVRPEAVAIAHAANGAPAVRGVVVGRTFYGHDEVVEIELSSGARVRSRRLGGSAWRRGDPVAVRVDGPLTAVPPPAAGQPPPVGTAR